MTDLHDPSFSDALAFAFELHAAQRRKTRDGEPPGPSYLGHVLGVAASVIDSGGTREQAIAGLLHDAVEDSDTTVDDIRQRFGDAVASIVEACTDAETVPKPPWRERKERYVEHLHTADPAALLVTAADKLNNARAIIRDHAVHGDELWDRFNPDADHRWYYSAVLDVVRERLDNPIVGELEVAVNRLLEILPVPLVVVTPRRRRRRPRALRPLTPTHAQRAIYFDFEGRAVEGVPPMLVGACWLEDPDDAKSPLVFRQYVLDSSLAGLARLMDGITFMPLDEAVGTLVELSDTGRRHLVSWSNHDTDVIRQFTEHRAFRHRNAIATARRWRRGRTNLGPGCPDVAFDEGNRLQLYLRLIGYEVPAGVREGAGSWMRTIHERLAGAGGDVGRLSPGGRQAWTNLVEHNRHDVLGMREVMLVATGLKTPMCLGDDAVD